MRREMVIFGASLVALQLASSGAQASTPAGSLTPISLALPPTATLLKAPPAAEPTAEAAKPPAVPRRAAKVHAAAVHHVRPAVARPAVQVSAVTAPVEPLPEPPVLSDQEVQVSQVAERNGDHNFLMVDKNLGKIILFQDGKAIFAGPALTGASPADRLPPGVLKEKFSKLNAFDTKVTPAGRYTVSRGRDGDYGTVLDINEIRGRDWGIAIHKVYLGTPSEHRDTRLRSPNDDDKHITFGCINVTPDAIRFLLRELPAKGATPLYILPEDETRTAAFFTPHNS
jgi:L,D-transpeptidase catalytic domain